MTTIRVDIIHVADLGACAVDDNRLPTRDWSAACSHASPPSYAPASKYTNTTSYSGTTSNSAIGAGNYAGRLQDSKIASRLR